MKNKKKELVYMDNENIYDAAYSETQVSEENETKDILGQKVVVLHLHLLFFHYC